MNHPTSVTSEQIPEAQEHFRLNEIINTSKRLLGRCALVIGLVVGPVASLGAGDSTLKQNSAEAAEFANDYPNAAAMDYSVGNYDWWVDENGNGQADVTPSATDDDEVMSPRGYNYRNCTDGVAYWVMKYLGKNIRGWGNANSWDTAASSYTVKSGNSKDVEPGDIAQSDDGGYGHVGFVTSVTKNDKGDVTSIKVAEMNKEGTGKYSLVEYQYKNAAGNFKLYGTSDWDHFIDVNGTGTGLSGEAVSTAPTKAEPEPQNLGDPYGNLETIKRSPGGIRIRGWALDPDDPNNATQVDVYAGDGYVKPENYKGRYTANLLREDVGLRLSVNSHRGFDSDIYMEPGDHRICVYGINVGPGTNRRYDCMDVSVSGTVTGSLEQAFRSPGSITLKGWALDPDVNDPVKVDFYESQVPDPDYYRGGTLANRERGDVVANLADRYAGYSPYRGFDYEVPMSSGLHALCAFAVNMAGTTGESNRLLGCHDPIDVTHNPKGWFEGAYWTGGGVAVRGWALDPDSADKVDIHFYGGDGSVRSQNWAGWLPANLSRIDIVPSNPGYGDLHGFGGTVPAPAGTWNICAYAINREGTPGSHLPMGCKRV